MKRIAFLVLFATSVFAQKKIRTFDQFSFNYGVNDKISTTSFSIGQEMIIGDDLHYSVGAFARLNLNRLNTQTIESLNNFNVDELEIKSKSNLFSLSIPLAASIGFRSISFGGNFDLASWTMGKNLESSKFALNSPNEGLIATPRGLGWVLGRPESMKNLNSQLFLNYSFEQAVSIRLGINSQNITYDLRNLDTDGGIGSRENLFRANYIYPFISLRFNNEK